MTLARARVLLAALPTYLVTASLIVGILIDELDDVAGIPAIVIRTLVAIAAALAIAIVIVRRVTPVLAVARGLLDNGKPKTAIEARVVAETTRGIEQHPGEFA